MKFHAANIRILFTFFFMPWAIAHDDGPDWTYDLLDLNTTNKTPDKLNITYQIHRISRGNFVIKGSIAVYEDLTDETFFTAEIWYTPIGNHFVLTPFAIPKMPSSQYLNTFYKDMILESFANATENPPLRDRSETFVPPLTKRIMVIENFSLSNENMPSTMRTGYYITRWALMGQVESEINALVKVEKKE